MAKITPGNKLYLYQLFSREIGVGKQELLPRYAEVLEAADVWLADFEAETLAEVLEACGEFIKLTTFKKGRVYATVLRNEEWDKWLAPGKPAEPSGGAKAGGKKAAGGKPWKAKGAAAKNKQLKPVKPRHKVVPKVEEPAAEEVAEVVEPLPEKVTEVEAVETPNGAAEVQSLSEALKLEQEGSSSEVKAPESSDIEANLKPQRSSIEENLPESPSNAPNLNPESSSSDESKPSRPSLAEQIEAETARLAAEEAEFRAEIDAISAEALAEAEAAPESATPAANEAQFSEPKPAEAPKVTRRVGRFASALAQNQTVNQPQVEAVTDTSVPEAPAPTPPASTPEPAPLPELTPADFGPTEEELRAPIVPRTAPAARPATPKNAEFPENFGADVHCKDELLRQLYQALPLDVDLITVLDEDWRVARSTGTLSGSRAKVTFPLRFLHDDGTPVQVTLRRASKPVAGKRWNLAYIDGDDGSGQALTASGIEGLPTADEGAWHDLSAAATRFVEVSPAREFAQFAVLGTWETMLGSLATMAVPERWNYPGEGVGKASRYGVLREYLTCTFHRARTQGKVAEDAEHSFAAFNTGLITPFAQDIYACFKARRGDIPWELAGFAAVGSGELGGMLAERIARLPEAPSYLNTLADLVPQRDRLIILDTDALLGRQLGMLPKAFLQEQLEGNRIAAEVLEQELGEAGGAGMGAEAITLIGRTIKADPGLYRRMSRALDDALAVSLRRAQASYRTVVPVYDPATSSVKQLLPLSLVNDAHVDCAIVLAPQPSGNTRATGLMSLPRAYACARVISAEQPTWLSPNTVLK